mgnify:CR=1 FL=1
MDPDTLAFLRLCAMWAILLSIHSVLLYFVAWRKKPTLPADRT